MSKKASAAKKEKEANISLPPKFEAMFKPKRMKVYYGGRGGAKTESFAAVAEYMAAKEGKKVLCLREFMNSINESVHSTLEVVAERTGLLPYFEVQKTQIVNKQTGDVAFSYGQLSRNLESIKSRQGIDIAWIEEGETISQRSLDILIPTIRKAGSEIWVSFNPEDEFGTIYSRYIAPYLDEINAKGFYEDEHLYVCKVGLDDNPFATEELKVESRKCKERDYKEWLHIWGGEPIKDYSDAIIKPEWVKAAVDSHIKLGWEPKGMKALGFDPADVGKDAKATAGRHGSLVQHLEAWRNSDLSDAIDRTFEHYRNFNADIMVYDSIGVGSGVKVAADRDDPMKTMKLVPFSGSGRVRFPKKRWRDKANEDTFKNLRAQFYWNLAEKFENTYNAVEKGIYCDPDSMISISSDLELLDALRMELSAIHRVRRAGAALLQVESKEEMIRRGVKSPNLADALVYCFSAEIEDVVESGQDVNFVEAWA